MSDMEVEVLSESLLSQSHCSLKELAGQGSIISKVVRPRPATCMLKKKKNIFAVTSMAGQTKVRI